MSGRIAIAAALLLQLLGVPLAAQQPQRVQKRDQLREALQEYREKKDLLGEAITLLSLGVAEADLVNIDSARSNLTDAAKKLSAQNDAIGTWMAHFALSHIENAVGRSKEAIAQIEKALAVIDDANRSATSFSLGTLLAASELPREMIDLFESNAEWMYPRILQDHLQPVTHDLYGSLLTQTGQLAKAEDELNKAFAGSKSRYDVSIPAHFGDLRFRQQRYDEARAHYQKALSGLAAGSSVPLLDRQTVMAGIYDSLARLEIISGHPEQARLWNDKALEIARSAGGQRSMPGEALPVTDAGLREALKVAEAMKNVARQAAIESRLGNLQMSNGNYGSAAAHFERSLQLYQSLNAPIAEATTWGDLCLVYIQTGNFDAAESALVRARKRVGNKSEVGDDMFAFLETSMRFQRGRATAKDYIASVERFIRHAPAEDVQTARDVRQMLAYATKVFESNDFSGLEVPSHDTIFGATTRLVEGMQELQKGSLEGARTIWRDALEKNPSNQDRASLRLMIGFSYLMELDVEQAGHWLTESVKTLEAGIDDIRSEAMLMTYLEHQQVYYYGLVEAMVLSGKIEQGFEASERARTRTFLRLLGNHRLKPPSGIGAAVVKEAEDLRKEIENWEKVPRPGVTLAELRRQYEELLPRVQVVAGEYASLTSGPAHQIEGVRNELPENTTLLSYFVTPVGIHTWILDKETLEHVRLTVSQSEMRRISCWAFELARPRGVQPVKGNGCGADSADASVVYETLIAPLRSKIRKKRLMIVPHGQLHYVPFAALFDEEHGKYLIEDYPITYVPSASTIRFLREKDSAVGGRALVLGDPVSANLPGAGREARIVARKLHTTAKLGKEAQESLLYQLDGKVDLLHIAAHGTYDATNPLFSAIHLAKGNGRNGQLNVDEIQSELDLSGVNLVVLSACRSGVGKRSGGDEIIGLTRSILYAGSPGVIATLWDISDEATPALIETFYDHLLAGATAADALRAAQVDMLREPTFAAPRFWAAFFLTGDPQGRWSVRHASDD